MLDNNKKKNQQLGMPHGTACGKLRKNVLFSLLKKYNDNYCHQCGAEITLVDDLSIEHIEPWLDSPDPVSLFFDISNIAFSHIKCNIGAARNIVSRKSIGSYGYKGIIGPTKKNKMFRVRVDGKYVGSFATAKEAAEEYDKRIIEHLGDKAVTNKKLGLL